MREFQQKRKIRGIIYSKTSIVILLIILFIILRASWGVYAKEKESNQNKTEDQIRLEALQQREEQLSSDILKLETPAGIEQDIRQNFRMAKSGEQLAIILDSNKLSQSPPQQSFWEKIWGGIKSFFGMSN
jgi:cell division protein FtsB